MRVGVFCGASRGFDPRFTAVTQETARAIAARGYGIVYGGGRVGLMGVLADAALEAGCEVIGVIPSALAGAEIAHDGVTHLHVVGSMHERKALMERLSDAFVALPGGYGTLDEFSEILTWAQLGIHAKPLALLNSEGFFDQLLALFDRMVREGFVTPESRALVYASDRIADILDRFASVKVTG